MKKTKRWVLVSAAFLICSIGLANAAGPFKKVSIATTAKTTSTTTTTSTTPEPPTSEAEEAKPDNGPTKNSKLTGIPQIDYIWDPNLPRELRGFNLSSYPFLSTVPEPSEIHFQCQGLHDGFYSSIEYKCQVYHHCVYGIRHDFLCANFTAFDQKTFICHFASDVDCEGSQKYWNRNDALYMATTTSTTTTTTTEPPPTPRRRPPVRPLIPLRRPFHRPDDDYYYEGEEEYADEYYEERMHRRRKQRPRQRKPALEYEDDYYEKRPYVEDEKRKRLNSRDRFHEEDESDADYDVDRRKYDRPKSRNPNRTVQPNDRRKAAGRKPTARPSNEDGRRSFGDDRPQSGTGRKEKPRTQQVPEESDAEPVQPRRTAGRRRIGDKRTSLSPSSVSAADLDDLDDYEKPRARAPDQEEAAADEDAGSPSKVKTTPKPLEEFVTPRASSSVYARPRAPPRIARPVPVNEKKKFQYPVQKTGTTVAPTGGVDAAAEDDYYEQTDDDYEDARPGGGHRAHGRRRDGEPKPEADSSIPVGPAIGRRRQHSDAGVAGRKPTRTTLRKPITEKKPIVDEEDYESQPPISDERYDSRPLPRRRPTYSGRTRIRGNEDVDFVDDEYEERPLRPATRPRPKAGARIPTKKSRPPPPAVLDEEIEAEADQYDQPEVEPLPPPRNRNQGRRKIASSARLRQSSPSASVVVPSAPAAPSAPDVSPESDPAEVDNSKTDLTAEAGITDSEASHDVESVPQADAAPVPPNTAVNNGGRPTAVRVVKRPFLPSRGGSPYLPRGLQPVGIVAAHAQTAGGGQTTDSTPFDMGSTISGVRLLEHGAPLLRATESQGVSVSQYEPSRGPRTTLPPRSTLLPVASARPPADTQPAKVTLDELYENDYDVTLNDALNPTLKPLTPQQTFHHHSTNRKYHHPLDSDSSSSSTDIDSASSASSTSVSSANAFVNNNQSPVLYRHQQQQQQQQQQQLQQQQPPAEQLKQTLPQEQVFQLAQQQQQQLQEKQQKQHQLQNQQQQQQEQRLHQHANAYYTMPSSPHHQTPSTLSLSLSTHSLSPQSPNHQTMHASLSQQQQQAQQPYQHQHQQHQYQPQYQHPQHHHHHNHQNQPVVASRQSALLSNYNSDSYFSPTDTRRRAAIAAPPPRTSSRTDYRGLMPQHYYDGFEY